MPEFLFRLHRPRWVLGIIALLLAVQIGPWWHPVPDGTGYLSIARSMAHGGPVQNLGSPKLHLAPGYPLLISPLFLASDRPFLLLSIFQWLAAVVLMLGVYRWSQRIVPEAPLTITALVMLNASLWLNTRLTISETTFMAVLVWMVEAMHGVLAAATGRDFWTRTLVAGLLMVLLCMVRPVGILFAVGYGLALASQAWQTRIGWTRAIAGTLAVGVPASLAILAFMAYETRMAAAAQLSKRTYLDFFADPTTSLAGQLLEGLRLRISETGRLLVPGMYNTYAQPGQWLNVNVAVFLLVSGAVAWGWWKLLQNRSNVWAWTLPLYVGLYVCYPYEQRTRYLLPMLPLLMACLWYVIAQFPRQREATRTLLVVANLLICLGTSAAATWQAYRDSQSWSEIDRIAAVLREDGRAADVSSLRGTEAQMLELSADRKFTPRFGEPPDQRAPHWLVAAEAAPRPEGYYPRLATDHWQLLERTGTAAQPLMTRK